VYAHHPTDFPAIARYLHRIAYFKIVASRGVVSFQVTILKVVAGQPEHRASLGDLRRAVALLISSGSDWTERTKRLAARAPELDIFSQSFVLRDEAGWQITDAGVAFLAAIETPISATAGVEKLPEASVTPMPIRPSPQIWRIGRRKPHRGAPHRRRPRSAVA
jgi:hypothetical protein